MQHRNLIASIFFSLIFFSSLQAQTTITRENLELIFAADHQVYLYSDTSDTVFQVDIGLPGGPHVYDFSNLQFSQVSIASTLPVSEVPRLASRYASDATAFRSFEDIGNNEAEYFIYFLLENGMFSLGDASISGPNERYEHLVPQEIVAPFPLNFGFDTSYTITVYDSSFVEGAVDEVFISPIDVSLSTDGWGTLILPGFGSFDCLRHIELDLPPGDSKTFLFLTREGYLLAVDTENTQPDSGFIIAESIDLFVSSSAVVGLKDFGEIPQEITLLQNYPNPFNPTTKIKYFLPKEGLVSLKVYDIAGREIKTLVNSYQSASNYTVDFSAANLPSGLYIYRLSIENKFITSRKMLLLK